MNYTNLKGKCLRETEAIIMIAIGDNDDLYINKLAKIIDTTYSHVVKIVHKLQDKGFIKTIKTGRQITLTLTKKGVILSRLCKEIITILEN